MSWWTKLSMTEIDPQCAESNRLPYRSHRKVPTQQERDVCRVSRRKSEDRNNLFSALEWRSLTVVLLRWLALLPIMYNMMDWSNSQAVIFACRSELCRARSTIRGRNASRRDRRETILERRFSYLDESLVWYHPTEYEMSDDFHCPKPRLLSSGHSIDHRSDNDWDNCPTSPSMSKYGTEHDEYRSPRIAIERRTSATDTSSPDHCSRVWFVCFSSTSGWAEHVYFSVSDVTSLARMKRQHEHWRLRLNTKLENGTGLNDPLPWSCDNRRKSSRYGRICS